MEGVDEIELGLKRKAEDDEANGAAKKLKAEKPPPPKKQNSAIYVTSLPEDVDVEELRETFSKYGVISERVTDSGINEPRIKLYEDERGNFKGDALIVYHRAESVQIAIDMLDETDFRYGEKVSTGPMRVTEADPSYKVHQQDCPIDTEQVETKVKEKGKKGKGKGGSKADRERALQKTAELNRRLANWSDDDDDPSTMRQVSNRFDKVVILKHMFSVEEVAKNLHAEVEQISDDIREACDEYGTVTKLVLYDQEPEGIVTVRFDNALAAKACANGLNGRHFDNRTVEASIAESKDKFKKTRASDNEGESERLENFGKFLDSGDTTGLKEDGGLKEDEKVEVGKNV